MTPLPRGIWAATLTPLNADLQCDSETLAQHAFNLISRGCKGIVLFGTTGEGPSFSVAERIETLEKLICLGFPSEKIILAKEAPASPERSNSPAPRLNWAAPLF